MSKLFFNRLALLSPHQRALFILRLQNEQGAPAMHSIAATFSAEPIAAPLRFWMQELDLPSTIAFAPYPEVLQPLTDPKSLLSKNQQGVNIILIRFEDWIRPNHRLRPLVSKSMQADLLTDHLCYTLPNGVTIAHLNPYETDYLYQEIWAEQAYLKHGIVLHDDACIVDVGANIGLFSLFVQHQCKQAVIYAFEPAPPAFDVLRVNTALYCPNVTLFNLGLADANTEAPFAFYPRSSLLSSYHADLDRDTHTLKTIILNTLQRDQALENEALPSVADALIQGRLEPEISLGQLRTLSSIIREHHITRIDLLKIDVEKSEWAVLQGITDQDWPIIQQVVVELSDPAGHMRQDITRLLEDKGFIVTVDEEDLLQGCDLYCVYATRPSQPYDAPPVLSSLPISQLEPRVESFGQALRLAAHQTAVPYLVCLCPPSPQMMAQATWRELHQHLENGLVSTLENVMGVHLVTPAEIASTYPLLPHYDPLGDELGHIPFTPAGFMALGTLLARKIHAFMSPPYQVIVLDCDGTLWQGDDLQTFMAAQHQAGMRLCLCGENQADDIYHLFASRPDMPLQPEWIAAWRFSPRPKSEHLQSLAQELQLSLDRFIFLNDDPLVCAEVEVNCPDVLTLQMPQTTEDIPTFLQHIWAFDHIRVALETDHSSPLTRGHGQPIARSMTATTSRPRPELQTAYVAPRTPVEEVLAAIWHAVLGVEQVGIHDNFFDLGGDAAQGLQVLSRVRDAFQVERLPHSLTAGPTIIDCTVSIAQCQAKRADPSQVENVLAEVERQAENDVRAQLASIRFAAAQNDQEEEAR